MEDIEIPYLTDEEIEFLKESNAIEGEYSNEALEDAEEAFLFAYKYMMDNQEKINFDLILTTHKILMKRSNKRIAGKFRKCSIYVGTRTNYRECLKPEKIEEELCKWLKRGNVKFLHSSKDTAIDEIERIHVEFENIHPFEDGNGRVGRILMNLQRIFSGMSVLIIHEGTEQQEYYKWFKRNYDEVER